MPTKPPVAEKMLPSGKAVPLNLAQAADLWFTTRAKRLEVQKQVDALEVDEAFLKVHLIDELPVSKAEGITGKEVTVKIERKDRAEIEDFDAFTAFVSRNRAKGAFALLNRAINMKSVKEYWAQGKVVPGLKKVQYKTLSYSATR